MPEQPFREAGDRFNEAGYAALKEMAQAGLSEDDAVAILIGCMAPRPVTKRLRQWSSYTQQGRAALDRITAEVEHD